MSIQTGIWLLDVTA